MNGWSLGSALRSGASARALLIALSTPMIAAPLSDAHAGGALPTSGHYVAGSGAIAKKGSTGLTVNQSSASGIIDWSSFSIGKGNKVNFDNGSGATLNRVTGGNLSTIAGSLKATGSVYLINPQGVIVSKTGRVVTGGSFIASSRDESDSDFMNERRRFRGSSKGDVSNAGKITSSNGDAVLIGRNVNNSGSITAANGTASLAAGNDVLLMPAGSSILISGGSGNVTNSGTLSSAQAQLTAAGGNVYALAGNNGGIVRATGTTTIDGHVWLTSGSGGVRVRGAVQASNANGSGGTVTARANNIVVSGKVSASATSTHGDGGSVSLIAKDTTKLSGRLSAKGGAQGGGGFVETSGEHVKIADRAKVSTLGKVGMTGEWLVDPNDFTIAASGGDITGAALSSELGTTDVTIASDDGATSGNGDIFVNDAVNWSGAHSLTLNAQRNIDVNANVTVAGSGGLSLNTGLGGSGNLDFALGAGRVVFTNVTSGNDTALTINGQAYTLENTLGDLAAAITAAPTGFFALAGNYDAAADGTYSGAPISTVFSGTLEGLGNAVSNISVSQTQSSSNLGGLLSTLGTLSTPGYVRDLLIKTANLTIAGGNAYAGGLTSQLVSGAVSNVAVAGTLTVAGDGQTAGGLVGLVGDGGVITGSSATVRIDMPSGQSGNIGGLVGKSTGSISTSFATGTITSEAGSNSVGGLVGTLSSGAAISGSWSSAKVFGTSGNNGGLVGTLESGANITQSYTDGFVIASSGSAGGLVGQSNGTISFSYAAGAGVESDSGYAGGIAGTNTGTITDTYASEDLFATHMGGVAGNNTGIVKNSFWNKDVLSSTGVSTFGANTGTSSNNAGLSQANMGKTSSFSGWSFGELGSGATWVVIGADGALNNPGNKAGGTSPMLLSEYSTTITNTHQLQLMTLDLAQTYTLGNDVSAATTGRTDEGVWGENGFIAVGGNNASDTPFSGTFDGRGYTIDSLWMQETGNDYAGLFGRTSADARIANVSLTNLTITSLSGNDIPANGVGGLVGDNAGVISHVSISGSINPNGIMSAGGIAGRNEGSISEAQSSVSVSVNDDFDAAQGVGGLVGSNFGDILYSSASGSVTTWGSAAVGGLVGLSSEGGDISLSSASGMVDGGGNVGGLVGALEGGGVENSFATGSLFNSGVGGGLVGFVGASASVTNSYASASVTATNGVAGGLVGDNEGTISQSYATGGALVGLTGTAGGFVGINNGSITDAYATGSTFSPENAGGFVGKNNGIITSAYSLGQVSAFGSADMPLVLGGFAAANTGTITNSYWDTNTSGISVDFGGALGETSAQLKSALPDGFDSSIWGNVAGKSFAYLNWQFSGAAPTVISGTVYTNLGTTKAGAGQEVDLLDSRNDLGSVFTYADGSFYKLVSDLPSSGVMATNTKGAFYSDSGDSTGLDIYATGLVRLNTADTELSTLLNNISEVTGTNSYLTQISQNAGVNLTASGSSFDIDTGLNVGTRSLTLKSAGSISESGIGQITAGFFSGSSQGTVVLNATTNAISKLGAFNTGSNGFSLTNSATLNVTGHVATGSAALTLKTLNGDLTVTSIVDGGAVTLQSAGAISEATAGRVLATSLSGSAGSATSLTSANNMIGALGMFSQSGPGNFALNDAQSLVLQDSLSVLSGNVTINVSGTLTESGSGSINTNVFGGSSVNGATLTGSNFIASLSPFANSGTGGLSLTDARSLLVLGTVDAGTGDLYIAVTGAGNSLNLFNGNFTTPGTATFNSSGNITQSVGKIQADLLTGSANGSVTMGGANSVGKLAAFSTNGHDFTFTNAGNLLLAGTFDAGTANVTIGTSGIGNNLTINHELKGQTVTLRSDASITEVTGGVIEADTLDVIGADTVALNAANIVGNLSGGAVNGDAGDFSFTDAASLALLDIDADNTIKIVTTGSGHNIDIIGELWTFAFEQGGVTLTSAGTISQRATGNFINTFSLQGSSVGGASFVGENNQVSNLGAFTNSGSGGFTYEGNAEFHVTGDIDAGAGDISLTSSVGTIAIEAAISTTGSLTLATHGEIEDTPTGSISAGILNADAFNGVTLGYDVEVDEIGTITAGNSVVISNAKSLTVSGAIQAGSVYLTSTGSGHNISVANAISSAGTVSLMSAGTILESGSGAINAATLTGSSDGAISLDGDNLIGSLGEFTTAGNDFSLTNAQDLNANGTINVGTGALSLATTGMGSDILIRAALTGGTVSLASAGVISANANTGKITAATLTGSSQGAVSLNAANHIATLGAFTTGGDNAFSLTDAQDLNANGTINAGTGALSLTTTGTGDDILIRAALTGGTVKLASAGVISANATTGKITAATLTGGAHGAVSLNAANTITNLGAFTTSGNFAFALTDAHDLTTTGAVNAGTGGLTLTTTGAGDDIVLKSALHGGTVKLASAATILANTSTGKIVAATLTGSAHGSVGLNAANTITNLGAFTTNNGAFALTNAAALTTTGTVNAGTKTIALTTTGTGHNLAIHSHLQTSGSAGTVTLVTAGNTTESSAGAIITHKLNVKAKTGITLTSAANAIGVIGIHTTTSGPNKITR